MHELTDGRLVATERDHHPDTIAEAFRRRITVLELQQIIGRGRGLWRNADNPLHVLVLTDVPLEMPVEELTTDAAERPSFEDRQVAAGAIAFEVRGTAAKAYPEIWKDADRAQYARRQHGRGQPAGTVAWRYQVAGQGERDVARLRAAAHDRRRGAGLCRVDPRPARHFRASWDATKRCIQFSVRSYFNWKFRVLRRR